MSAWPSTNPLHGPVAGLENEFDAPVWGWRPREDVGKLAAGRGRRPREDLGEPGSEIQRSREGPGASTCCYGVAPMGRRGGRKRPGVGGSRRARTPQSGDRDWRSNLEIVTGDPTPDQDDVELRPEVQRGHCDHLARPLGCAEGQVNDHRRRRHAGVGRRQRLTAMERQWSLAPDETGRWSKLASLS